MRELIAVDGGALCFMSDTYKQHQVHQCGVTGKWEIVLWTTTNPGGRIHRFDNEVQARETGEAIALGMAKALAATS
jgi:hypothetical protein